MRKRWFVIPAMVVVLAVAIGGSAAFAQGSDSDGTSKSLTSRVAEILGLDEETVVDAVDQARSDMFDEALQAKLDALVAAGHMTQEQADDYKAWLDDRPEGTEWLGDGGFGRHHRFGGHGFGWSSSKHFAHPVMPATPKTQSMPS